MDCITAICVQEIEEGCFLLHDKFENWQPCAGGHDEENNKRRKKISQSVMYRKS